MKKIIYLFLLLIAYKADAQKEILFKMKYLPGHNYNGDVSMTMNCNVALSGDSSIINAIKAQGISQPVAFNMKLKMGGVTKTGMPAANKIFPLTMIYKIDSLNVNLNGKTIPIPAKTNSEITVYGHVGSDGKLQADSLGGGTVKDTSQQKMTQMMNAFQNKIKFPEHPMHIGETFTQDMPFNIPIAGNNTEASLKATYKLVSMSNGSAYFDVEQSINMNITIKQGSINLTGGGTGKLVYDMKNNFPTDYQTNISLKFNGKLMTLQIDGTAAMNMSFKYMIN